jgi:hypothetical protein
MTPNSASFLRAPQVKHRWLRPGKPGGTYRDPKDTWDLRWMLLQEKHLLRHVGDAQGQKYLRVATFAPKQSF